MERRIQSFYVAGRWRENEQPVALLTDVRISRVARKLIMASMDISGATKDMSSSIGEEEEVNDDDNDDNDDDDEQVEPAVAWLRVSLIGAGSKRVYASKEMAVFGGRSTLRAMLDLPVKPSNGLESSTIVADQEDEPVLVQEPVDDLGYFVEIWQRTQSTEQWRIIHRSSNVQDAPSLDKTTPKNKQHLLKKLVLSAVGIAASTSIVKGYMRPSTRDH